MLKLPSARTSSGQTYVGLIIAMGIFIILSQTIFSLVISVFDLVSFTRARTVAQHLATEKLETIKNLTYTDVGVVGGVPNGIIPQVETTLRGGLEYTISTTVVNVDDPFDGVAPVDTEPSDFRAVEVAVTWGGLAASNSPVLMNTNISQGLTETASGGTLTINVVDANGAPVPSAQVSIFADEPDPDVNVNLSTDLAGQVTLPGSPSCSTCYEITVTAIGSSTDRTVDASEVTNPSKPHLTVIDGEVTIGTFAIDALGIVDINSTNSRASGFTNLPNQAFRLRGSKILGTDAFGSPVYKYDEIVTTDGSSNLTATDMEWDDYHIIIPEGGVWDVSGTNPLLPFPLFPGQTASSVFSSEPAADDTLLALFLDGASVPIASVSATLSQGAFTDTIISGEPTDPDHGQAFFNSLSPLTYTLDATASGYLDFSRSVIVSGYTVEQVNLIPE